MLSNFYKYLAILILSIICFLLGLYLHYDRLEKAERLVNKMAMEKQIILEQSHQFELDRLQFECYNPNLSRTNQTINRLIEMKDYIPIRSDVNPDPIDIFKPLKDLVSNISIEGYDITPYLNYLPLPVTTLQYFSLYIILLNCIMLSSLLGYMVNESIKIYGDKFKEKFPKWILPFVNSILTMRKYVGYMDLMMIFIALLISMVGCVFIYSLPYFFHD